MRYIYYIIGIFVLTTAVVAVMNLDRAGIDVSRPAVVINDRIITEAELETLMASKPHDMTDDEYIDSLIMNTLLIQDALDRGINREEPFRRAVERYYEQSLVKALLDRKYGEFDPRVTDAEVAAYQSLSTSEVVVTRAVYASDDAAREGENAAAAIIEEPFRFLSGRLRFILLGLAEGESSEPVDTDRGVAVYTLEEIREMQDPPAQDDPEQVRAFIANQKKQKRYAQWMEELREQADIWRRK